MELAAAPNVLRRHPGFVVIAVLVLSVAVGINAVVFSLVERAAGMDLPFEDSSRLYWIESAPGRVSRNVPDLSWAEGLEHLEVASFSESSGLVNRMAGDQPQRLAAAEVDARFFEVLGVSPFRGRLIGPEDLQPGRTRKAVLSHRLWQTALGGEEVVGETLVLDGLPHTVIGITPAGFDFPGETQIWVPFTSRQEQRLQFVGASWSAAVARLKAERTNAQAQAELKARAQQFYRNSPFAAAAHEAALVPLIEKVAGSYQDMVLLIWAGALLVLVVTCVNLANVHLSRFLSREKELAIRKAMGAGRRRIIAQLSCESSVVGVLTVGMAFLVCFLFNGLLGAVAPSELSLLASGLTVDYRAFLLIFVLGMAASLAFGVLPALWYRRDIADRLRIAPCATWSASRWETAVS